MDSYNDGLTSRPIDRWVVRAIADFHRRTMFSVIKDKSQGVVLYVRPVCRASGSNASPVEGRRPLRSVSLGGLKRGLGGWGKLSRPRLF